jgi:hypothetical protein
VSAACSSTGSVCLLTQQNIHIRWDWSLACLIRCSPHRVSLCDGCQDCGEPDPLPLSSSDLACRSCGGDLTQHQKRELEPEHYIQAIEDAYRAALLELLPINLCSAKPRMWNSDHPISWIAKTRLSSYEDLAALRSSNLFTFRDHDFPSNWRVDLLW